jgi:hypothetical protein
MAATAEPNFNLGPFGEIKFKNLKKFVPIQSVSPLNFVYFVPLFS